MQCACAILSHVAWLALQFFSTLSHKRHDFFQKKLLYVKVCSHFFLQILSEIFLILRRNVRDMIKNVHSLYVKYSLFLSDFNDTNFLFRFYLFCTMTRKCTIISQIITLLHVSTLSCHPQSACNQCLTKLHKYFKCSCWSYSL